MNIFSVLSLFAFIIYLYIGLYAFKLEKNSKINRLFFYLCISMAVWSFAYAFVYIAEVDHGIWIKISAIGWCTFSALILHLVLVFTKNIVSDKPLAIALIYAPGLLFLYMSMFLFWPGVVPSKFVENVFYIGDFIYNFSYLLISITLIFFWGRRTDKIRQRKQANIIAVTSIIPFILDLLTQSVMPLFGINLLPPLGQIYSLIMIFGIYYASIKYRLFGISSNLLIEEILTEAMDLIILVSPDRRIVKVNNRIEKLLDYKKNELINKSITTVIKEENLFSKIFDTNQFSKIHRYPEINCVKKSGELVPVSISCSPIIDLEIKDLLGIVIVGQDITLTKKLEQEVLEHKEAEEKIKESEERFRSMFNKHTAVMYLVDIDTLKIFDANEAAEKYYGYTSEEFKKIKITDITGLSETESKEICEQICMRNKGLFCLKHRIASGDVRDVEVHASPIPLTNKQMIFCIMNDITERKKAEEHITFLAYHDSLTGLPNRKYFYEKFSKELDRAKRGNGKFAVLYLDMDSFKKINDNLGHEVGDYLLCEAGRRIKNCVRASDMIARVGGDEFIILISDIHCMDDAQLVAEKIFDSLGFPISKDGKELNIQASIGISMFPDDGDNLDTLINNADNKMYLIKRMKKTGTYMQ